MQIVYLAYIRTYISKEGGSAPHFEIRMGDEEECRRGVQGKADVAWLWLGQDKFAGVVWGGVVGLDWI